VTPEPSPTFPSEFSFLTFATSVRSHWRYFLSTDDRHFVDTVLATAPSRAIKFLEGTELWRARNGCAFEDSPEALRAFGRVDVPFSAKDMKPLVHAAKEGRVNSKGIPALYAATHKETALAEVRPGVGGVVTLAMLHTVRTLWLVNCSARIPTDSRDVATSSDGPQSNAAVREMRVWSSINDAFAKPVSNPDNVADYVPTQVLAEAFKRHGYSGIVYRSGLVGSGMNVALFNLDDARVGERSLVRVTGVAYTHEPHISIPMVLLEEAKRLGFTERPETAPPPPAPASPDSAATPSGDATSPADGSS
jgi:hypothetical protein